MLINTMRLVDKKKHKDFLVAYTCYLKDIKNLLFLFINFYFDLKEIRKNNRNYAKWRKLLLQLEHALWYGCSHTH